MLFALVVMAGVLLVTMVFNNRRRPSPWDDRSAGWDGGTTGDSSAWAFGGDSGGDTGSDCSGDAGGDGCDGGDAGGGGD